MWFREAAILLISHGESGMTKGTRGVDVDKICRLRGQSMTSKSNLKLCCV